MKVDSANLYLNIEKSDNGYIKGISLEKKIKSILDNTSIYNRTLKRLKPGSLTYKKAFNKKYEHQRNVSLSGVYFLKEVDFFVRGKHQHKKNTIIEAKYLTGKVSTFCYDLCARVALNFPYYNTIVVIGPLDSKDSYGRYVWKSRFLFDLKGVFSFVIPIEKLDDWLISCINKKKPEDYKTFWENYFYVRQSNTKHYTHKIYGRRVLSFLFAQESGATSRKMGKHFRVSYSAITKLLDNLIEEKKVVYNGGKYYVLLNKKIIRKNVDLADYLKSKSKFIRIDDIVNEVDYTSKERILKIAKSDKRFLVLFGKVMLENNFYKRFKKIKTFKKFFYLSKLFGISYSSKSLRHYLDKLEKKGFLEKDEKRDSYRWMQKSLF